MDADPFADDLVLDGNAIAGQLNEMFGIEMTGNEAECAGCGEVRPVGALLAFTQGPGIVLRCPNCSSVMLRVAQTPRGIYMDARGSVSILMLGRS